MTDQSRERDVIVFKRSTTFAQFARITRAIDEARALDRIKHEPRLVIVGITGTLHHGVVLDTVDHGVLLRRGYLAAYGGLAACVLRFGREPSEWERVSADMVNYANIIGLPDGTEYVSMEGVSYERG